MKYLLHVNSVPAIVQLNKHLSQKQKTKKTEKFMRQIVCRLPANSDHFTDTNYFYCNKLHIIYFIISFHTKKTKKKKNGKITLRMQNIFFVIKKRFYYFFRFVT